MIVCSIDLCLLYGNCNDYLVVNVIFFSWKVIVLFIWECLCVEFVIIRLNLILSYFENFWVMWILLIGEF